MLIETYYTKMLDRPEVWCLGIDKENKTYELQARTNPESYYRFLAMPTFIQVLSDCAGFKQFNIDNCA